MALLEGKVLVGDKIGAAEPVRFGTISPTIEPTFGLITSPYIECRICRTGGALGVGLAGIAFAAEEAAGHRSSTVLFFCGDVGNLFFSADPGDPPNPPPEAASSSVLVLTMLCTNPRPFNRLKLGVAAFSPAGARRKPAEETDVIEGGVYGDDESRGAGEVD